VGLGLDTCPLKDKAAAKIEKIAQEAENRKLGAGAVRPRQHGRALGTAGHGEYHEQPVVAPGHCGSDASRTLCFVLFLV